MATERSRLDYALAYAATFKVLPLHGIDAGACTCGQPTCKSPGKHPRTQHGVKDASQDSAQIERWWQDWPHANIGISPATPDVVIIDIDPRNGGDATWDAAIERHGALPDTLNQASGGGGTHYLCRLPAGHRASALGAGIDLLGMGKYIVAEPSGHVSGNTYQWRDTEFPFEDAVMALLPPGWRETVTAHAPSDAAAGAARIGEQDMREVESALALLEADDYDIWIRVGMALHSTQHPRARFVWEAWSQRSPKYDPKDAATRWAGFNDKRDVSVSYRSIFHMAKATGWGGVRARGAAGDGMGEVVPLKTLIATDFPPLRWMIPDLLPEGFSLLVGAPKAGKSFLVMQMALAVARGLALWAGSAALAPTGVLYAALEDSPARLKKRFALLTPGGLAALADHDVPLYTCTTRLKGADGLTAVRDELQKRRDVGLLIIDTLGAFRDAGGKSPSYHDDYAFARELKALADENGIAVLAVHHTRKAESPDFMDAVSGTHGLAGAADTIIVLQRARNQGQGTLSISGRDIDEERALQVNRVGPRWEIFQFDLAAAVLAATSMGLPDKEQRVYDLLEAAPDQCFQAPGIADALGEVKATISTCLGRLKEKGYIQWVRRGYYASNDYQPTIVSGLPTIEVDAEKGPTIGEAIEGSELNE